MGYVFTSLHGKTSIDPKTDPFTAIARFDIKSNPDGSAKLIKSPWRMNQHRGEADAFSISNQQQDIYEIIAAELQTVKKSSQIAGWIKLDPKADGAMTGIANALMKQGKTAAEIDALINGDGSNPGLVGVTYESLEALSGGKFEYLQPGESVEWHNPQRPNINICEFIDWIQIASGASMGIGRARSTGKAETSYTAFRGEEIMSWQTFEWEQKFLERRLLDFLGVKAIRWALKKREITEKPAEGWESRLSWAWPKMREVNELVAEQAMQLLPSLVAEPSGHIKDRIIFRGQVFVPTRVLPRGSFGYNYAVLTVDCNQVNSDELVNDPQFQPYALIAAADPRSTDG
jgi:capsid protein